MTGGPDPRHECPVCFPTSSSSNHGPDRSNHPAGRRPLLLALRYWPLTRAGPVAELIAWDGTIHAIFLGMVNVTRSMLVFAVLVALASGCSDSKSSEADAATGVDAASCPALVPTGGTDCTVSATCTYFFESCDCGPDDLYWHCECANGEWECFQDFDCYPCGDAGTW